MSANLGTAGKLAVDTTANDKTRSGVKSAEKTLGGVATRTSGSVVRTFGRVEEAAARAFGGDTLVHRQAFHW